MPGFAGAPSDWSVIRLAKMEIENRAAQLENLKTFLRIPSISALPEHKLDIRRAAEFCANELRQAGMSQVVLIESDRDRNPLVYAEWLEAPGKPTLLL
jgi:acetylornithine deacetylase/succinyl-diaminopimelate desuccinylase-like protein